MTAVFSQRFDCEVLVVGAGPAGSALATHLAGLGHDVIVLDKGPGPRQKACGEFINPDAVRLLEKLGVLPDLEKCHPKSLRGMRIHTARGETMSGDFPGIATKVITTGAAGAPFRFQAGGISLSRPVLDGTLARHAARQGAEVRYSARVTDLLMENGKVTGVVATEGGMNRPIRSRLVVGADGRHSIVARRLDLRRPHRRLHRTGYIRRYSGVPADGEYGEVFLSGDSYCILNPTGQGDWTVGIVLPSNRISPRGKNPEESFQERLRQFPGAFERVRDAAFGSTVQGCGPMAFDTSRQVHAGLLLVGDAAGFYDPLTGEGIHIALKGAEIAAAVADEALRSNDLSSRCLSRYETLRREHLLPKRRFCALLQALIRSPFLVDSLVRHLNRAPALRETFMGVIGDTLSPAKLLDPSLLLGQPV